LRRQGHDSRFIDGVVASACAGARFRIGVPGYSYRIGDVTDFNGQSVIRSLGTAHQAEKGNENSEAEEDDQVGPPPGSTGVPMLNIGFHGFHSSHGTSFGYRFMMEGILIPDMVFG
jgi:hypothetical protein